MTIMLLVIALVLQMGSPCRRHLKSSINAIHIPMLHDTQSIILDPQSIAVFWIQSFSYCFSCSNLCELNNYNYIDMPFFPLSFLFFLTN